MSSEKRSSSDGQNEDKDDKTEDLNPLQDIKDNEAGGTDSSGEYGSSDLTKEA